MGLETPGVILHHDKLQLLTLKKKGWETLELNVARKTNEIGSFNEDDLLIIANRMVTG